MFGLKLWEFPRQEIGNSTQEIFFNRCIINLRCLCQPFFLKRPRQIRPVDPPGQNGPELFNGGAHGPFYVASVGHSTFCTNDLNELQILGYYPERHEKELRDETPFMSCSYRHLERLEEFQVTFLLLLREKHRLRIRRGFSMIS